MNGMQTHPPDGGRTAPDRGRHANERTNKQTKKKARIDASTHRRIDASTDVIDASIDRNERTVNFSFESGVGSGAPGRVGGGTVWRVVIRNPDPMTSVRSTKRHPRRFRTSSIRSRRVRQSATGIRGYADTRVRFRRRKRAVRCGARSFTVVDDGRVDWIRIRIRCEVEPTVGFGRPVGILNLIRAEPSRVRRHRWERRRGRDDGG